MALNILKHLLFLIPTASSTSDLSFIAGSQVKEVSGLPDPLDAKTTNELVSGTDHLEINCAQFAHT